MTKYTWGDFFDFSDDTPLNEFGQRIEGLQKVYVGFAGAIEKSNERISESLTMYRNEAKMALDAVEKQTSAVAGSANEMNDAAKKTDVLFASTKQLKEMESAHNKELAELRDQLNRLNKARDDSRHAMDVEKNSLNDLKRQIKEAQTAYEKMGAATDQAIKDTQLQKIRDLSSQFNIANRAVTDAKKSTVLAAKSYDELSKSLNDARRELKSMENGFDQANPRVRELTRFIDEADKKVKAFDTSLGQSQRNVGNYPQVFNSLGAASDKILPGVSGNIGKIGGSLMTTTGLVGGLAIGAAAMGKAFYEESVRIKKSMEQVNTLTGLVGKSMENFTARASATAKVFDKEFNEVIRTGNVIMQSFGVGGTEAMETINQAFLRGSDISGDFLEQMAEYSTFIAQAGGDTQDLVDILLASERAGVFSDKGLDTIKEATLRLRELTPATRDAIKGLGLSVSEIENGLRDGSKSVLDVIRMITKRMGELPPISAEVGTAIADIFAGPGEDAGQFLFTLGKLEKTQEDWTKSLTGSYLAQYELLQATQEYEQTLISTAGSFQAFSTKFDTWFTRVKTVAVGILAELSNEFTTFSHRVDEFNKSLANVDDIQVLNQELQRLQEQLEEGPTWWQKGIDYALSLGAAGVFVARNLTRQAEIQEKIRGIQERINVVTEESTRVTDDNTKSLNESAAAIKKMANAEFELKKFRLEQQIKAQEIIAKNESNFSQERIAASQRAEQLRNQLIELERQNNIRNEGEAAEKLKLINERAQAEINENKKNAAAERVQISIDEREFEAMIFDEIGSDERRGFGERADALRNAAQKRREILDTELANNLISFSEYSVKLEAEAMDLADKMSAISVAMFESQQDVTGTVVADALTDLENEFTRGTISLEEYYRRRSEIQSNGERISLNNQLDYLTQLADGMSASGYDVTDLERQISETRLAIAENTNQELLAKEQALQQSLADLRAVAVDTAMSIITSSFEREQMALDERLTLLQERGEVELQMAGDNATKRSEIEARLAREEENIKRQQAAASRKKAVFDKFSAVFDIGINTAIGISKAVAASPLTGGLPFSAIIGAIGALQIAAVLSKPIPAYAEGTEYHPGGLAIVGDAGPEFVQSPDGSMSYYDKPTLGSFDRGSRVYNADDTRQMIESNGMMAESAQQYMNDNDRLGHVVDSLTFDMGEVVSSVQSLEETVRNKRETHINITRAGVQRMVRDHDSWTEYFNQNYF